MGRILGPVNYGILASLYSILYLIGIIPTSASVAIVKFVSAAPEKKRYSIYWHLDRFVLRLAVVAAIAFLLISPPVANFLRIENLLPVVLVSPILFFSLITLVKQAAAQGILKFSGSVVPTLVSAVVKLILGFFFIYLGWSVAGAMVAIVIAAALAYFYGTWFLNKVLPKEKIMEFNLKPFFVYSLPVLVQALAFTSLFTIDVILVKHFLTPFEAGIYAALSILGKIVFFAASPITATMFPIVSRRKAARQPFEKVFFAALALTAAISSGITIFYWLFPDIAIGLLYGRAYLVARAELVWMGMFMFFYSLSFLLVNFSLSLGKVKIVWLPLVAALAQIPALWFFHGNILQIIQISLTLSVLMFFGLVVSLGYNRLKHE
jgi:O-antigen/teichoic acid export membrane protein